MARWTEPMSVAAGGAGLAAGRGAGRPAEDGDPQTSAAGGGPGLSAVRAETWPGTSGEGGRWRGGAQGRGATAGAWGAVGAVSTMAKGSLPKREGGARARGRARGLAPPTEPEPMGGSGL
ncbi:hypothetical protein GCM10010360_15470 [Streptomyces nogalater]